VAVDDALHDGEAGARSLVLVGVEPLKDGEELLVVTHVETDAVVLHREDDFIAAAAAGDLDDGRLPAARELDGVRYAALSSIGCEDIQGLALRLYQIGPRMPTRTKRTLSVSGKGKTRHSAAFRILEAKHDEHHAFTATDIRYRSV
jgi:hypothetical protein